MITAGLVNLKLRGSVFEGGLTLFRKEVQYTVHITVNSPRNSGAPRPENALGDEITTDEIGLATHTVPLQTDRHPTPENETAPQLRAPCSMDSTLVFDDAAIADFDTVDIGGVPMYVIRPGSRLVLSHALGLTAARTNSGATLVAEENWTVPSPRKRYRGVRHFPLGRETSVPGARLACQLCKADRSATLYLVPRDRTVVLGDQKCVFASAVFQRVYLAVLRKGADGNTVTHVSTIACPKPAPKEDE